MVEKEFDILIFIKPLEGSSSVSSKSKRNSLGLSRTDWILIPSRH